MSNLKAKNTAFLFVLLAVGVKVLSPAPAMPAAFACGYDDHDHYKYYGNDVDDNNCDDEDDDDDSGHNHHNHHDYWKKD